MSMPGLVELIVLVALTAAGIVVLRRVTRRARGTRP